MGICTSGLNSPSKAKGIRTAGLDSQPRISNSTSKTDVGICTEVPSYDEWVSGLDMEGSDSESESLYDSSESEPEFQAMAMRTQTKYWTPGKVIRIRFLGGTRDVREKVIQYAKRWEDYANITFKFVREEPSHIRISFDQSLGCYSSIGTDAKKVKSPKATMNLAVSSSTPREVLKRYVLHEFGHVLGCVHEHSSPAGGIQWDRKKVYAHYRKTQGWSKEEVDDNVLRKYDNQTVTQFSKFDPHSIMIYHIPSKLTKNGFSVPWNTNLSPTDKKFIAAVYPKESRRRPEGQTSGQGTGNRKWQGQSSGSSTAVAVAGHWQGQGSGTQVNSVCYCPQCTTLSLPTGQGRAMAVAGDWQGSSTAVAGDWQGSSTAVAVAVAGHWQGQGSGTQVNSVCYCPQCTTTYYYYYYYYYY